MERIILILSTMDTKGPETLYLRDRIRKFGGNPLILDMAMSGRSEGADIPPDEVARTAGADIDDSGFAVGVLAQADDLRSRCYGIAREDRRQKFAFGVAEIGDRVERYVGYGFSEHDVEDEKIVERRRLEPELLRKR